MLNFIVNVQTLINNNIDGEDEVIKKAIEKMIKELRYNLNDGGSPKVSELAEKFGALTFSINEGF